MLIGDARASTDDHNPGLQRDGLCLNGCEKIRGNRMNDAKAVPPGLKMAHAGDEPAVWRLDRLRRSLHDSLLVGKKRDGIRSA